MAMDLDNVDVNEAYSPPRVTVDAAKQGLEPGSSFDLTGVDDEGNPWDLSRPVMQRKCREQLEREKVFDKAEAAVQKKVVLVVVVLLLH